MSIYVITTLSLNSQELDTAGAFADLDDAKREVQRIFQEVASLGPAVTTGYRFFIEEWDATTFESQRHLAQEPLENDYSLPTYAWYVQPADETAPFKEGGVVS